MNCKYTNLKSGGCRNNPKGLCTECHASQVDAAKGNHVCSCGHTLAKHQSDLVNGVLKYICPTCQNRCPELNHKL